MHCSCHALTKHTVQQQHSARHIQKGMVMLFNKREEHSPPPQPLLYTHLGCTDGSYSDGASPPPRAGELAASAPTPRALLHLCCQQCGTPQNTPTQFLCKGNFQACWQHTHYLQGAAQSSVAAHIYWLRAKSPYERTQHHPGPFKSTGRMLECLATRYGQCPHHSYIFN